MIAPIVRTFEPGELRATAADFLANKLALHPGATADAVASRLLVALGIDGDGPVTVVSGRLQPYGCVRSVTPDPDDDLDTGLRLVPLAARPNTDDEPLYRVIPDLTETEDA